MTAIKLLAVLLPTILPLYAQAPAAAAHDWFVRAGATGGDGSRAAPFHDPWQALAVCEAGDRVHVAGGKYFGRLGTGGWVIAQERVQLLGGYDERFAARDPWRNPTQLCWQNTSKNWCLYERLRSDQRDVVVDGLVVDMQDQVQYLDEKRSGRTSKLTETAMRFSQPATVRNCIVVNPGFHAIDCVAGSTIENNIVVNAITWGIVVTGAVTGVERATATVRNNTVLFSWDTEKPGAGGYGGAALALRGPAIVDNNVLAHSDNNAIYAAANPEHLTITGNVFWQNRFSNLSCAFSGKRAVVNDKEMEMMEDVGLAREGDNRVADPELPIEPSFFTTGCAPAISLETAIALVRAADAPFKAGARRVALPPTEFTTAAATTKKNYQRHDLPAWNRSATAVSGKPVEMIIAVGSVANISQMPASYPQDNIAGMSLYDPDGAGEWVTGFYLKGSIADRICSEATGWYRGNGKPDRLHLVRGIAHAIPNAQRAAFYIEHIERFEPPPVAAVRPVGRDWFVRAGATGGDGSREKPFRDPFQPLERCEAGDTIHVASGDYFGKLKAGRWSITMPNVSLLGGYDADFTVRAPWQHATRLYCPAEFQGARTGYTIEGAGDHTGAVVDGFVFDKRLDNVYAKGGELDVGHSDKIEHLWLSRPRCIVRNCVFMNGAAGAVRLASGHEVSNNVFLNHVLETVKVERGHTTDPFVFRDNTAMFVWAMRFGYGHGASGSLLRLTTGVRAVVENNVLAYADNDAIRIETDPSDVVLRNNAFSHNLWSNVQNMPTRDTVDDGNFAQLGELGLRAHDGNRVELPEVKIDAAWLEQHQSVRNLANKEAPPPPPEKAVPTGNPFDDASASSPPPPTTTSYSSSNPFEETSNKPKKEPGEPFAPAYEWQTALQLFAAEAACGARRAPIEVVFAGIERVETKHEYAATTWDVARVADAWGRLDGTRVQIEVAIKGSDNQFQLTDISKEEYACHLVSRQDGDGLPLRCYVRRGTKAERAFDQAKGFTTGKPLELHVLRGIARERRQMIVEAVEKVR